MSDHASERLSGGAELLRVPEGAPMAGVRGAHCGGCHLRLLPRLLQQIRRSGSVIGCPHCGRLLFHEALSSPGAAVEKAARVDRGSRKPARLALATKGR